MAAQELQTLTFPVTDMTCAAYASSVESMIGEQPGVNKAEVNYATQSVGYDLIIDTENYINFMERLYLCLQ